MQCFKVMIFKWRQSKVPGCLWDWRTCRFWPTWLMVTIQLSIIVLMTMLLSWAVNFRQFQWAHYFQQTPAWQQQQKYWQQAHYSANFFKGKPLKLPSLPYQKAIGKQALTLFVQYCRQHALQLLEITPIKQASGWQMHVQLTGSYQDILPLLLGTSDLFMLQVIQFTLSQADENTSLLKLNADFFWWQPIDHDAK